MTGLSDLVSHHTLHYVNIYRLLTKWSLGRILAHSWKCRWPVVDLEDLLYRMDRDRWGHARSHLCNYSWPQVLVLWGDMCKYRCSQEAIKGTKLMDISTLCMIWKLANLLGKSIYNWFKNILLLLIFTLHIKDLHIYYSNKRSEYWVSLYRLFLVTSQPVLWFVFSDK